jgi:spermidine/putrescine transport system permease protein
MSRRVAGLRIKADASAAGRAALALIAYGLPILFILLPLAAFLTYSFFSVSGATTHYDLTLLNYRRFFTDPVFLPVFWRTCLLCLEVAVLAVAFGYPVAFFLAGLEGRRKYTLLLLLMVPLLMSYVIKIYAIRSILGGNGFLNRALLALGLIDHPLTLFVYNLNAVLLTLTALLIPFAVLPIFLSLERIPRNLLEASADLGASNLQSFTRIVLPLSLPGTVTAATFVFVLAIGDFLTPQMVGGLSGFTFGRIIYSQFGTAFNWPFGSALSVILAAVVILAILAGARLGARRSEPQRGAAP